MNRRQGAKSHPEGQAPIRIGHVIAWGRRQGVTQPELRLLMDVGSGAAGLFRIQGCKRVECWQWQGKQTLLAKGRVGRKELLCAEPFFLN